jgi:hypothetical protein
MTAPVSITVPAEALVRLHGHLHEVFSLPIHNGGTTELHLTATTAELTASAKAHPVTGFKITFSPAAFSVAPGHTKYIQVTVNVPKGDGGEHVTDIVFAARTTATTGAGHLAAAVATKVEFESPGKPLAIAAQHPKAHPVAVTGQHLGGTPPAGFPIVPAAGGALGAALLVSIAGAILRRRARRIRSERAGYPSSVPRSQADRDTLMQPSQAMTWDPDATQVAPRTVLSDRADEWAGRPSRSAQC